DTPNRGDELLEYNAIDISMSNLYQVVLNHVEGIKGVHTAIKMAFDSPRGRREYLALAVAEGAEMKFGIKQMRLVGVANGEYVSLYQGSASLLGNVTEHPQQIHVAELALEFRESALRDELHQYRVVAFEGGINLGIVL